MKHIAKFGSKINLSVRRANGRLDHFGEFFNHPRAQLLGSSGSVRGNLLNNLNFRASSDLAINALSGTWDQSGTTISRVSGSDVLPNQFGIYKFADGTVGGWRISGAGEFIGVSKSQTVAAQALYFFPDINLSEGQDLIGIVSSRDYAAGIVTISSSAPASFSPASSAYTLRSIYQSQFSVINSNGVIIKIDPEISIDVGDQIIINSYEYTFDYGGHTPRAFAVSPISGLSGSGFSQRTRRITVKDSATNPTRIFLITDANKIVLPDMFGPTGGTLLNPSSYTMAETITATGSSPAAATSNDMTESHSCYGTTAVGGTIKQIAWGTTSEIFGIIEYDTPVVIATSKVLTVGMNTHYAPTLTLP